MLEYLSGTHNGLRVDISDVNSSDICICRANDCVGITKQQSFRSSNGFSISEPDIVRSVEQKLALEEDFLSFSSVFRC